MANIISTFNPGDSREYSLRSSCLYYGVTEGTASVQTVIIKNLNNETITIGDYFTGMTIMVKFGVAPASGATLNVNGLGDKTIKYRNSINGTYFTVGAIYLLVYDGTNFVAVHSYNSNSTYSAGTGISLSGSTFSNSGVRSITQDSSDGHKLTINTGGTSVDITIPDSDSKVEQKVTSSNYDYPIILAPNGQTSDTTGLTYFSSSITVNPSTETIKCNITGHAHYATSADSAITATQDSRSQQIDTTYIKGLSASGNTITYTKGDGSTGTITVSGSSYTLPTATSSTLGGVKLGSSTTQTVAANSVTTTASRTYAIQMNSSNQLVVNVPWTSGGSYTLPAATENILGGIKLGTGVTIDSTNHLNVATALDSMVGGIMVGYTQSGKNYPVVLDSNSRAYVNVPWNDTNTTYSASTGLTLSSTTFSASLPTPTTTAGTVGTRGSVIPIGQTSATIPYIQNALNINTTPIMMAGQGAATESVFYALPVSMDASGQLFVQVSEEFFNTFGEKVSEESNTWTWLSTEESKE